MTTQTKAKVFRRIWEEEKGAVKRLLGSDWSEFEKALYKLIDQLDGATDSELHALIDKFVDLGKQSRAAKIFEKIYRRFRQRIALNEVSSRTEGVSDRTTGGRATTGRRRGGAKKSSPVSFRRRRRGSSAQDDVATPRKPSVSRSEAARHRAVRTAESSPENRETSQSADSSVVRRTPHLDLTPNAPIAPSSTFVVSVYADQQAARSGENVNEIELDVEVAEVGVSLVASGHFEVLSKAYATLTIDGNEASTEEITFEVRVRSKAEIQSLCDVLASPTQGSITAVFAFKGRPVGRVSRIVEVGREELDAMTHDQNVAAEREPPRVHIVSDAMPADITVEIVRDVINDGRQFHCRVTTAFETSVTDEWQAWNLPAVTSEIVGDYMKDFIDGREDILQTLIGAGRKLFEAAPDNFKALYWELLDKADTQKSMAIVSDEPYVPWELMVPHRRRSRRNEEYDPLGVTFAIARWVTNDSVSPEQKIPLDTSVIVAPNYGTGRQALPHAIEEAEFVQKNFRGVIVTPATKTEIDKKLLSKKASILHFCCHGKSGSLTNQVVELEGGSQLESAYLGGSDGFKEFFNGSISLVFLNACEVGRQQPSLVGIGGFAKAFIDLGAAAVVAALWSVKDELAHDIAMEFYREVLGDKSKPFADIFRSIRSRAYDRTHAAEDTYAAYCFYGDPLARAS